MPPYGSPSQVLTADDLDVLGELINVGVGRSAAALSELTGVRIVLRVPAVSVCSALEREAWQDSVSRAASTLVVQDFRGPISGQAGLLFDQHSSLVIAQVLSELPELPEILTPELTSILLEVGNIVLGAVLGSLANQLDAALTYALPTVMPGQDFGRNRQLFTSSGGEGDLLLADVEFRAADFEVQGTIVIVFALGAVEALLDSVDGAHRPSEP